MLYEKILKPLLFAIDPEKAHDTTLRWLEWAGGTPPVAAVLEAMYGVKPAPSLATRLFGLSFANPVGLAAGLDKNGMAVPGFSSIGFGFMEVGTVTPRPQPGNDSPRLFRLPEHGALINRMGFNNLGAEAMAGRLGKLRRRKIPLAVNIGKNKVTPNERAADDYRECLNLLYPYGDFFVVNVSSPNTPGLRKLQQGDELAALLEQVMAEARRLCGGEQPKPVLVKLAPDIDETEMAAMVDGIVSSGISGIIATNTTIGRSGVTGRHAAESGGLSGRPLTNRATEVIRSLYRLTDGKLPIIGCGGIFDSRDAYDKILAGASMVEIYTSLIYRGPGVNRALNRGLCEWLERDGFTHISQAVGQRA